jgi:transcriptional regulator with XRE-family HTH domain
MVAGNLTAEMGVRLRARREELGLTQDELAGELGVTRQHLSRIELGHVQPTLPMLLSLSRQLGVSTDWLLIGSAFARSEAPSKTSETPDVAEAIRADQGISEAAKSHLIGIVEELLCHR